MAEFELPEECFYTREDEWVRHDGTVAYLGVTDYAQDQLGDIVFVELPEVGATLSQGEPFGVIESVKAVSDLYAPLSGEVVEVNGDLADAPETINESCYGDGWLLAVTPSDAGELDTLMNAPDYAQYIKERQD
ncbi:MAG: glycine cleavage system protein GcvH [Myxococcota bacterium]|nr:glycine cleavage system protein GcvH [Myxococcota bacterium]